MTAAKKIILDCDPGRDDAFAIALILASPDDINLLGITAVAGNVPVELTERNARLVCDLCGQPEVPVYAGAKRPLQRQPIYAADIHGDTGLEGIEVYEPNAPLQPESAVDYMLNTLSDADAGTITIVAIGPLTNLAIAYDRSPDVFKRAEQIVIMGGAQRAGGNITPAAEFNVYADPHAAARVLESGCSITMFGLDVTHQVLAGDPEIDRMQRYGGATAKVLSGLLRPFGDERIGQGTLPLHDPCTIAWLLQPDLFRTKSVNVEIECDSPLTQGMTVVDMRGKSGRAKNVQWAYDVDGHSTVDFIIDHIMTL